MKKLNINLFSFSENPIVLPSEDPRGSIFFTMKTPDFCRRIVEFGLAYMELNEVPTEICNFKVLRKLDISHNEIDSLPEELCRIRFENM